MHFQQKKYFNDRKFPRNQLKCLKNSKDGDKS